MRKLRPHARPGQFSHTKTQDWPGHHICICAVMLLPVRCHRARVSVTPTEAPAKSSLVTGLLHGQRSGPLLSPLANATHVSAGAEVDGVPIKANQL